MANQNSNSNDIGIGGGGDGNNSGVDESGQEQQQQSNEMNSYQVIRLNHQDRMSSAFESMLCDEMLCDVTIICNGQAVKAHRVILAASSTYFKEIFHHIPFGFCPIVFLKNFTNEDLNDILEFVYKGELVVPTERIDSLIDSAKSLGIAGLATLRVNNNINNKNNQQNNNNNVNKLMTTSNSNNNNDKHVDNSNDLTINTTNQTITTNNIIKAANGDHNKQFNN
uniref:Protein abrupt-like n=1 Tax=Dermatophagoides pteronyssinus TaxID=6956 RepID=A0A6P6Y5I7_DERPT|nr:protein abrupt-like [Dermatophagoides pteronyssinus]